MKENRFLAPFSIAGMTSLSCKAIVLHSLKKLAQVQEVWFEESNNVHFID